MAAGFLITRILLVCLLSGDDYSSAFPTASLGDRKTLQDGKKQGQYGYGNRRPLHYIRALRQPNRNAQPNDQNQNAKIQKQTLGSSDLQDNSQAQRNYTGVRPRGFELNLDVPVFDLLNQKGSGLPEISYHGIDDAAPKYNPGVSISSFDVFGNKELRKDLLGGGNGPGEAKPSLHLSFSVPSSATSPKPSQSSGGHFANHFANSEPENLYFKNLYTELEKQLGSMQTGLKLPFLNHTDRQKHKQGSMALKWPSFNDIISGNQQSQQAYELFSPQSDGKLNLSPWLLNQSTRPQQPKDKPIMQNWVLQKPALNKPTSVEFQNYPDHADLYNAHTSFIDYDEGPNVRPNPANRLLSLPSLQFDRIPNKATHFHTDGRNGNDPDGRPNSETQSSLNIHGSLSKGLTHEPGRKPNHGNLKSNFQLSLSVPIPAKAPTITKVGGGDSNIKFELGSVDGDYMRPAKQSSIYSGSKFPNKNFDRRPQIDSKWPILDLDAGHRHSQEQAYDPFPLKPNDDELMHSSWHFNPHTSSRQNTQDKPAGLNWALQKPSITKPAPVLPLSKYEVHGASTGPRKFQGRIVDNPSQSHSFHHSNWVKPSNEGNYVRDLSGYSDGTRLSLHTKPYEYNQMKPSIARTQVAHHLNPPQSSLAYHAPSFVDPVERAITNYELGKLQKDPKRLTSLNSYQRSREGPFPHQHPSDHLNSVMTPGYRSPNEYPERDADVPILHGKGKYAKLFLNVEGGDDDLDGQTYFTAQKTHKPDKWTGENMANTNSKPFVNLQASVSVNKNSLGQLLNPSDIMQSHVQTSCTAGVGDCSKPDKYWQVYNVPEPFNHSPYAEATVMSAPSLPFQQVMPESNRHLIENVFGLQQYPGN